MRHRVLLLLALLASVLLLSSCFPTAAAAAVDPDDEFADDEDVYGEVLDAEEDVQDDGEGEGEDVEFGAPAGGDGDDGGDSEYSAPKPLNVPVGPKSYFWESVGLFVVFLYIVVYINGTRANNATANAWMAAVEPLMQTSFTSSGIGATWGSMMKESSSCYKYFASGRARCRGLLATLDLKKRHDLLSMVLSLVWPAEDTVTIDIPLESMHPYVMAVVLKSDRKTVQDETQDLLNFARPVKSDSGLPDQFVVLADSPSVVPLVLRPEIVGPIKKHQHLVKIVHVTDSVPMSSVGTGRLSRMAVRLQFLMPAAEDMAAMVDLIKLSLALIDVASGARLAEKAMKHAQALRNKAKEQSLKEERERLQEAAAQRKAERVAKEREEMRKLPREEQRKRDEKERKRQLKKQMRSRVRVVG